MVAEQSSSECGRLRTSPSAPIHVRKVMQRYTADAVNAAVNRYADPQIHCDIVHLWHPETSHEHAFVVVRGGIVSRSWPPGAPKAKFWPRKSTSERQAQRAKSHSQRMSGAPFSIDVFAPIETACLKLLEVLFRAAPSTLVAQAEIDRLLEFTDASRDRWKARLESLRKDDRCASLWATTSSRSKYWGSSRFWTSETS